MKPIRAASPSHMLHSGDGGGTFDAMEQRVAKLEQIAEETTSTLKSIMAMLGGMDGRLGSMDFRLGGIDVRLTGMDARFDRIDARLAGMDARFDRMDARLVGMDLQIARIDAKLDSKPDQGWVINLVCAIFGLMLATAAASLGAFALIR